MDMMNLDSSQAGYPAPEFKGRLDFAGAANVERAIELQTETGNICAIEFMRSHNIKPDVIFRVLAHPDQRRPRDGKLALP